MWHEKIPPQMDVCLKEITMKDQHQLAFDPIDIECRRWLVSPDNPDYQLNKFVGNKEAVKRLSRAVFSALGKPNRDCSEYSFAICGPASTGKTYLAKLFADVLKIPFVSIEPQSIESVHDIFVEMERVCAEDERISLIEYPGCRYFLPPMIVFIDEVHNLKNSVVQGLLKATEPNDRIMVTEKGYEIRTDKVCWMIATTDRGDLFDAFDTRFQKVNLQLYSMKEMAEIVKMNNPDFDEDVCLLVAKYNSQVPREALAFARDMRVEKEMSGSDSWEDVAKVVAKDHGIDEHGMTIARAEILRILGQGPVSAAQLPFVVHVKPDELRKFILPPLMSRTPDRESLVTVSARGYTITKAGLEELDRRSISNRGLDAMPEQVRRIFEFCEN
jgi:Holliday junction resolvasome RuvABC ATP-dependent DNA helicase subunit